MQNKLLQTQSLSVGLLTQTIDNLSAGLVIADIEGNFVLWNEAADSILKMPPSTLVREWTQYFSIYHVDGREYKFGEQPILRAIKGEIIKGERLIVKNERMQSDVFLSVDAFPLLEDNTIVGGVAVFSDITDKVKLEILFEDVAKNVHTMRTIIEKSLK